MAVYATSIPAIIKLAACLRFFAQGSYQRSVGNDFHVAVGQSTFSEFLRGFLLIMEEHICSKWIKARLTQEEEIMCKSYFERKYGFPGVIGCVDGTHVRIVCPDKNLRHLYYCRKGFYSLNVMIVSILYFSKCIYHIYLP